MIYVFEATGINEDALIFVEASSLEEADRKIEDNGNFTDWKPLGTMQEFMEALKKRLGTEDVVWWGLSLAP